MIASDPPFIALSTSQFECRFDCRTGFLRQVEIGGTEVLRAIYGAVRDEHWGTVPATVADVRWNTDGDGFDLSFDADCRSAGGAHFRWRGAVRGRGGALEYTFDGHAQTSFRRNRIGLCVLHPPLGCAGRPCRVWSPEGAWTETSFPFHIAPHQPFHRVRALTWSPAAGLEAELRFDGEVFETEDQRNWTDASFKTYGTPLDLPHPVTVAQDESVRQRVEFRCARTQAFCAVARPLVAEVEFVAGASLPLPPVGLGMASHGRPLDAREIEWLARLGLSHLRVDLWLADSRWEETWRRVQADATAIGTGLHCAVSLRDASGAELDRFVELALRADAPVTLCSASNAGGGLASLEAVCAKLGALRAPVAVGTDANFAELNRARPSVGALVNYPINPQVHAFDDLSLMENLAAQIDTVASAVAFGARGVVVSAVTLLPCQRASSAQNFRNDPADVSPASVDPRQRSLFAAAWTLGSLAQLAPLPAVQSLTYHETTGGRGVLEGVSDPATPELAALTPGEVFPLYHVFADLAGCRVVRAVRVNDATRVAALGLLSDGGDRLLLANLQPEPQRVRLRAEATWAAMRVLDEDHLSLACSQPESFRSLAGEFFASRDGFFEISLPPYATARLDLCP